MSALGGMNPSQGADLMKMLAPLVMFNAGAPIRKELAAEHLLDADSLTSDAFLGHVQETMRRALAHDRPDGSRKPPSTRAANSASPRPKVHGDSSGRMS